MVDILKIYFHIRDKMRNSQELHGFFYHQWMHTKSFYDAICYLAVKPNGVLEEIMHDADLEYLGRDYYPYVVELLRKEQCITGYVWKAEQISFLKAHQFMTSSARLLFDNQKDINYRRLLNDD